LDPRGQATFSEDEDEDEDAEEPLESPELLDPELLESELLESDEDSLFVGLSEPLDEVVEGALPEPRLSVR
jgi:Ran GTPase-activating protein (RanGAP) involved in mRNA processing and transport